MKIKTNLKILPLWPLAILSQSAHGAMLYNDLETQETAPGSGAYQFVNPGTTGWSGNGNIAGPAGYNTSNATMINNFSGSGTLDMGPATGFVSYLAPSYAWDFLPSPTTTTMTVTLTGGTGDIGVNLRPGGRVQGSPIGFGVNGLMGGVTSVTVAFHFSEPVATYYNNPPGGSIPAADTRPFLAGFRTQDVVTPVNFDAEYFGLRHTTSTSTVTAPTFAAGLPTGVDSVDLSSNGFNWGSQASFSGTSSDSAEFKGVHLFDVDSDSAYEESTENNGTIEDPEAVYGTGMSFTFTPGAGDAGDADGFLDGSNFLFSLNGAQYEDTFDQAQAFVVPEPTGVALLGLSFAVFFTRRHRL